MRNVVAQKNIFRLQTSFCRRATLTRVHSPKPRSYAPALLSPLDQYHLTENYYIINSETIMDVNNYIPFSTINSQAIYVM